MRFVLGFVLGVLLLITHPQVSVGASTEVAERDAVMGVMKKIVDTWNRHDMEAFANLFSQEADFVNVRGVRWIGRDAIRTNHAAAHATIFKNSRLSVVGEISVGFLKPDVAVVRSITEITDAIDSTGRTLPPRDTLLTLVVMNIEGKWTIVVAQNTNIDTGPAPTKP